MSKFVLRPSTRLRHAEAASLEVKAEASGKIVGYGAIFGNIDLGGERIVKGAFAASLAEHARSNFVPKMLWMHDASAPIGRWTRLVEDGRGLHVEGDLNLKTMNGREAYEHLRGGDVDGLSVGYRVKQAEYGQDARDLIELDLYEISVVAVPMNPGARVTDISSKAELIEALRAGGLSKQAAGLVAAGGWKALSKTENYDHEAVARLSASISDASRALKDI